MRPCPTLPARRAGRGVPLLAVLLLAGAAQAEDLVGPRLAFTDLPVAVRSTATITVNGRPVQDIVLVDGVYEVRYRDERGAPQRARIARDGRLLVDGTAGESPDRTPSSAGIPVTTPAAAGGAVLTPPSAPEPASTATATSTAIPARSSP